MTDVKVCRKHFEHECFDSTLLCTVVSEKHILEHKSRDIGGASHVALVAPHSDSHKCLP